MAITYLNNKYKINIPQDEKYEALGGFILGINQDIPKKNKEIFFDNLVFKIYEVSDKKIELIELEILY